MRKLWLILFVALAFACDKDEDPGTRSSIEGYWMVETPDGATTVTFRITKDADSEYIVDAASVRHDGTNYDSKPIDAAIGVLSATEIESITILTTGSSIPFFVIRLNSITATNDFTVLEIQQATFNIDGVFRQFEMITASR